MLADHLRLSEDKTKAYLLMAPQKSKTHHFTYAHFTDELKKHCIDKFWIFEEEVNNALIIINNEEPDWIDQPQPVLVAEARDGMVNAIIEESKMKAFLEVIGAYGGAQVTGNDLLKVLKEAHVIRGVKKNNLQKLHLVAQNLAPGEVLRVPIAVGRLATEGEATVFKPLVEDAASRILKPQLRENGSVDMRNLGAISTVIVGQPLMQRLPPTEGITGYNVLGEDLLAIPGKELYFHKYAGSEVKKEDPNLLIATRPGMPLIRDNGVEVDETLSLSKVDVSTGHIDFEGSIVISGDVSAGMQVYARGNIVIGGFVESAEVVAGNDIIVYNGVIGSPLKDNDSNYNCVIKAGGAISAKFVQYARIKAKKNITLTMHALHSDCTSDESIHVHDASRRNGLINGGIYKARRSIYTVNLGSAAGTHTYIYAFNDYEAIKAKQIEVSQRREENKRYLFELSRTYEKVTKAVATNHDPAYIEQLKQDQKKYRLDIVQLTIEVDKQKSDIENRLKFHTITSYNRVYPNVECHFGGCVYLNNSERGPTKMRSTGYQVEVEAYLGG